jgi:hypothetical protein
MTTEWQHMLERQSQINAQIRELQREMGMTPVTIEQRAERWARRQAEIARARAQTVPRIRFPAI